MDNYPTLIGVSNKQLMFDKIIALLAIPSLVAFSLIFALTGCGGPGTSEQEMVNPESLEGSWRLIKTIEHGAEDTTNRRDGSSVIYQKHITPTHFMWIAYDLTKKKLMGTGGGTYTYDGSNYVEDIHFFYPPGSNERGQKINFKADFGEGGWRHTGYVKVYDFDPDSGDNLVSDSIIIDEIWERIELTDGNTDLSLTGTWELVSYKEVTDSVYSEYPGFVAFFKHLTPSHFAWVHFNRDGDEVLAAATGSYTLVGDDYVESLSMVHPRGVMQDTSYPFKATTENGRWILKGVIFTPDPENPSDIDTAVVNEIWKLVGNQPI